MVSQGGSKRSTSLDIAIRCNPDDQPCTACMPTDLQIWRYGELGWQEEEHLPGHTDWVRDVAWAPNLGLPKNTIASCGQDGQVSASGRPC